MASTPPYINQAEGIALAQNVMTSNRVDISTEIDEKVLNGIGEVSAGTRTANTSTVPDPNIFIYVANQTGTYTNFSGIVVSSGDMDFGRVELRLPQDEMTWIKVIVQVDAGAYMPTGDFPNIINLESKFIPSKNKFNKDGTINEGFYLNTGGTPASSATSSYSDYIPVIAGDQMVVSGLTYDTGTGFVVAFYNDALVKQSQLVGTANMAHTIPTGVTKVRFNTRFSQITPSYGTIQYEEGTVATAYESYGNKIPLSQVEPFVLRDESVTTNNLANNAVIPEKTSFFEQRSNLFDKDTMITSGFLLQNGDGLPVSSATWAYTIIPIDASKGSIVINKGMSNVSIGDDTLHFFDIDGLRVGTSSNLTATPPPTSVTLRMNISNVIATNLQNTKDTFMVEYGSVAGKYLPYMEPKISNEFLVPDEFKVAGNLITAVGDSITKGTLTYISYVERLNANINVATVNKGDNGATIANIYPVAACISGAQLTFGFNSSTKLVIFASGTNDKANNLPIGTFQDGIDGVDTTVKGSLYKAIKWVQDNHPGCKILVMTPIERSTDTANTLGLKLIDYRNAIIDVAARLSVNILDLFSMDIMSIETASTFLYDGLHPNDFGYIQMTEIIQEKVVKILSA